MDQSTNQRNKNLKQKLKTQKQQSSQVALRDLAHKNLKTIDTKWHERTDSSFWIVCVWRITKAMEESWL